MLLALFCLGIAQATSAPEQIHIAYAGRSANGYPNSMAINWFTQDQTATSTVRFGLSNTSLTKQMQSPKPARQYLKDFGFHHSVTLPDLSPATVYYYQVGDTASGWSSINHFTSAPDVPSHSYNVALFGDMGYLGSKERPLLLPPWAGLEKNWSAVPTRALLERLRGQLDMLLLVGDISYADDAFASDFSSAAYEKVYNGYMNWLQNLSSVMPWMVTVGNHESECHSPSCLMEPSLGESLRNFTAYNARFTMPSNSSGGVQDMWYSYNLGPVHWVSLNSETDWPGAGEEHHGDSGLLPAGGFAPNGTYFAWLENDLKQAASERASRPWILAYGHRPFPELNRTFGDLFAKYGVDMYFAGHSHSYSRSGPLRYSGEKATHKLDYEAIVSKNRYHYRPAASSTSACTYIVIGSAGCDEMRYLYDPKTNKFTQPVHPRVISLPEGTRMNGPEIVKVSAGFLQIINGSAINFTLYDSVTNEVLDTVLITK